MSEQELKAQGNEAFKQKKYNDAESLYKQAIAVAESSSDATPSADLQQQSQQHVYHSNLAACYFEQGRLEDCVKAADQALALEPSWLKAYYRKALALEALAASKSEATGAGAVPNTERVVLAVWEAAQQHCESSALLKKQLLTARVRWLRLFRREPVLSSEDLLERYSLLTDSREKLSTMAHLWNASSKSERLQHFNCFLAVVAGAGGIPELPVAVEHMMAMPLHNYHDLPRAALEPWVAFFEQQAPQEKTRVFREIWGLLSDPEQTAVIADLRLFLGMQMQQHQEQGEEEQGGASGGGLSESSGGQGGVGDTMDDKKGEVEGGGVVIV